MNIILLDIDGVILESVGYHLALQETVRRVARSLGFGDLSLSPQDIATFEAGGITSEWDEAAICSAGMMMSAWEFDPLLVFPTSFDTLDKAPNQFRNPDFSKFACDLTRPELLSINPLLRAERYFLDDNSFSSSQKDILIELIRHARDFHRSLTYRTFQELALGTDQYSEAYGAPGNLNCSSYLLEYDKPLLRPQESLRLNNWIKSLEHAAVILTSRPSRPPDGAFSPPEAELGAALVGLSKVPIIGWGGIIWLGEQYKSDPQDFLKPSPIHALTALRMALGKDQKEALSSSALLVKTGQTDSTWAQLDKAQVAVFEDTPTGILSLSRASQVLSSAGIELYPKFFGIAANATKKDTLARIGAQVFKSISEPLNFLLDRENWQ
jgi:hypothetical protein